MQLRVRSMPPYGLVVDRWINDLRSVLCGVTMAAGGPDGQQSAGYQTNEQSVSPPSPTSFLAAKALVETLPWL